MKVGRAIFPFLCASLASCAGTDSGESAPDFDRPLPHSICLRVRCEGKKLETWGTEEEWREDLVTALRDEFHVSEVIYHNGEMSRKPDDADVSLRVRVVPVRPRGADVESSAAVLDILAYITIPLLPLWIRDVRKDPGLRLEVDATFTCAGSEAIDEAPVELPDLLTSLLDRFPFFSWTTLGAVLVPPFVFEGEDRSEHMEASMGSRVRRLGAAKLAPALKRLRLDPEGLIRDIRVSRGQAGTELSFEIHKDVSAVIIRAGQRTSMPLMTKTFALGKKEPQRVFCGLPSDVAVARIEVESLGLRSVVRCYTQVIEEATKERQGS